MQPLAEAQLAYALGNTFTVAGPGCARGLGRVFHGEAQARDERGVHEELRKRGDVCGSEVGGSNGRSFARRGCYGRAPIRQQPLGDRLARCGADVDVDVAQFLALALGERLLAARAGHVAAKRRLLGDEPRLRTG